MGEEEMEAADLLEASYDSLISNLPNLASNRRRGPDEEPDTP
jgi:hypothetical protein